MKIPAFLLLLAALSPVAAAPAAHTEKTPAEGRAMWKLIDEELAGPAEVVLANGRTLRGHPAIRRDGALELASAEGAGEVVHTFEPARIRRIRLPGDSYRALAIDWMEAGLREEALGLMSALFEQRVHLLPLLEDAESHFFVHYLRLVLESADPARAIAIGERLRPQIQNPAAIRVLDDARLEACHRLRLDEDAETLARKWVSARRPYGSSALGHFVLAAAHLRADRPDAALETALQPIVFSSAAPMDYLAHCYVVAAAAALELREPEYARHLYLEIRQRHLDRPDEPRLEGYLAGLSALEQDPANASRQP